MFLGAQRTTNFVSVELILPDLRDREDEPMELSYLFKITKSYALKVLEHGEIRESGSNCFHFQITLGQRWPLIGKTEIILISHQRAFRA